MVPSKSLSSLLLRLLTPPLLHLLQSLLDSLDRSLVPGLPSQTQSLLVEPDRVVQPACGDRTEWIRPTEDRCDSQSFHLCSPVCSRIPAMFPSSTCWSGCPTERLRSTACWTSSRASSWRPCRSKMVARSLIRTRDWQEIQENMIGGLVGGVVG